MRELGAALDRLNPQSRALLDLSLRGGLSDVEIAEVIGVGRDDVASKRSELLERLAAQLGLRTREQRDELRATLPDLPAGLWPPQ